MKPKLFLLFCYFLFLALSGRTLFTGLAETWNSSADDHYAWILKNPQLTECFTQDCRFIQDAKKQLIVDFDKYPYQLNYSRWREQHCLFDVYTLLYNVEMDLLKKIFNLPNYETAYQLAAIIGFIFVSGSVLLFLVTLFGYYPAGIAFLMMSFSKWGILYFGIITPSFFVTGMMLACLTCYIRRPAILLGLLPLLIPFMGLYHSIGKLYAVILLILTGTYFYHKFRSDRKILALWSLSVISFVFVAAIGLIEIPQFKLASFPFLSLSEILAHFSENIRLLLNLLSNLFFIFSGINEYIGGLGSLVLLYYSYGLLKKTGKLSQQQLNAILVYFGLMLFSALHFFKNHPGELSGRLMVPFFMVTCGAMAFIFVHVVLPKSKLKKRRRIEIWITVLFSLAVLQRFEQFFYFNTPNELRFYTAENNLYSPQQVSQIFDKNGDCGTVLYLDQTPMWYYSTYGALKCGAIIGYAWPKDSPELSQLLTHEDLNHAVALNPLQTLGNRGILFDKKILLISFKESSVTPFKMRLKANTLQASGGILLLDDKQNILETKKFDIKPHSLQEIELTLPAGHSIQVVMKSGAVQIEKASFSTTLNWPWDHKILFRFVETDAQGNFLSHTDIDLQKWQADISNFYQLKFSVIEDSKTAVLMKVIK